MMPTRIVTFCVGAAAGGSAATRIEEAANKRKIGKMHRIGRSPRDEGSGESHRHESPESYRPYIPHARAELLRKTQKMQIHSLLRRCTISSAGENIFTTETRRHR